MVVLEEMVTRDRQTAVNFETKLLLYDQQEHLEH